jgi:hypothetical protein
VTDPWHIASLLPKGSLGRSQVAGVVECAVILGARVWRLPDNGVHVMGGDGMSSLLFSSLDGAFDWLAENDGFLLLEREGEDVGITVAREDQSLSSGQAAEDRLAGFDSVGITVEEKRGDVPGGESIWAFIRALLVESAEELHSEFSYVLSESGLEHEFLAGRFCVNRSVSQGHLPPFVPWMAAAPADSPLMPDLERCARIPGTHLQRSGDLLVLSLTDEPRAADFETFVSTSSSWRRIAKKGCQ